MEDLVALRRGYLDKIGIDPDSIPGVACLEGDWDASPGFVQWKDEQILRAREEDAE